MITLMKNFNDDEKIKKKINVKKIILLEEVLNKPINEIKFIIKHINEIEKIKSLSKKEGKTKVIVQLSEKEKTYVFRLKENRNIDNKQLNSLKIKENFIVD